MADKDFFAVIMAGGVGSRFWPASTQEHPKQFQDLLGLGKSFLQMTFDRMRPIIPEENIFVLTNERYQDLVKKQLPMLKAEQIVPEPAMRNTAPCNLLAALKIHKKNKDSVIAVVPSDHYINNEEKFRENMALGMESCRKEKHLLTLGIQPDRPHTGYGYINYEESDSALKPVGAFVEKPNFKKAVEFLESGGYLWNAGIFIWRSEAIIEAFQQNLPEDYTLLNKGVDVFNTPGENEFIKENYPEVENISIDYGIMEQVKNVKVIPADFQWSDLGSWGSLYEQAEKDENENVSIGGGTYFEEATGNLIRVDKNKLAAVRGLQDFIVVEEDNTLLICPKSDEQEVKKIRAAVGKKFGEEWT